jgi:3-oxoacyl-[acyl-carrier-protein] synthase-1
LARDLAGALGLAGPTIAVSNACASGLVAIIHAARMVRQKRVRAMLVVGADTLSDFVLGGFSSLRALSSGPCRPYDKDRSGLSLGEGAGALLIAEADAVDAPPAALMRGWNISNDANHITGPSRTGEGLKKALRAALEMSGLPPDAIDYVNGHGTGTLYNDEMEAQAFHAVFGDAGAPVTSMKGYFGHTLGAAGVIETALCAMVLRDKTVPASLGFRTPGVGAPIRILDAAKSFEPMRALVTVKSGFGGVNAALVMTGPD